MIILALDTALSSCSAAVIKEGVLLSEVFENRMRGQAERLLPLCQQVCAEAGVSFDDLGAIATTRGPGTFTGVRIGLAAAKGLALALKRPLIGITTLEVVARQARVYGTEGPIIVAHDARRGEVYFQTFESLGESAGPGMTALTEPRAVKLSDLQDHVAKEAATVVGTGAQLVKENLPADRVARLSFPAIQHQPTAAMLAMIAAERAVAGVCHDPVAPLYLRAPDAIAAKPIRYPFQNQ